MRCRQSFKDTHLRGSSLSTLASRFPPDTIATTFMTAACVHMALVERTGRVSGGRFDTLAAIPFSPIPASSDSSGSWSKEVGAVAQELDQLQQGWIRNGEAAVVDCAKFVGVPEGGPGAIGVWVLWGLYNEAPADDERELISAIERVALDFCTYWE